MSYNRGPNRWNNWFSKNDLNALISIWGREDDLGFINFDKNSFDYKYKKISNKSYVIKIEIGFEEIDKVTSLNFKDKVINVEEDIISVFNLIKGRNDITGKIYRLYNSSLEYFQIKMDCNTGSIQTLLKRILLEKQLALLSYQMNLIIYMVENQAMKTI